MADKPLTYRTVLGHKMASRESGAGAPALFLHGNPTSSFLWRDVMAVANHHLKCLAPDLIGMGHSEKLADSGPDRYRFVEHRRFLDGWIDQLQLDEPVILVLHDWGSALGFDWARRNPERVRGIVYMEAIVRPLSWAEWPQAIQGLFQSLRSPAGDELILEKNFFVERILPGSILRRLSADEMAAYRAPFDEPGEARRPTLTWPRELPIDGSPADVVEIVTAYADWLQTAAVPKLFVNAEPGAILVGEQREYCRQWPNQTEITVPGIHFIQEDSGAAIGRAIVDWVATLG